GTVEINLPIFFFKDRRQGRERMILRKRKHAALLHPTQGLQQQVGAQLGQARSQRDPGIRGQDGHFFLQQDITGIQALVEKHGGDAGDGFTPGDSPLNRRGAAILRQQRSMNVDVATRGKIEHPRRNQAPIAHDDDGLWLQLVQTLLELLVGFDFFRLNYRKSEFEGGLLDRRRGQGPSATLRAVRLGYYQLQVESSSGQTPQRRHSKLRRPAENQLHVPSPARMSFLILRFMMSRFSALMWLMYSLPCRCSVS